MYETDAYFFFILKGGINMYGEFGGMYVDDMLKERLVELKNSFKEIKKDKEFRKEYLSYLKEYVGRPSNLYYAKNLTEFGGGAKIYLKREDMNFCGSHKINNALGQILLARKMGKTHIIAETGAGSHGVAVSTVCALFKMKCTIFMGSVDIKRQQRNVLKMKMLGSKIVAVKKGTKTLKEAVDEAFSYYSKNPDTYYLVGSTVGPSPYPEIVSYFQEIIGFETKQQILKKEKKLPTALVACCGGGSNSLGLFKSFLKDDVRLIGIEAGGDNIKHASSIKENNIGILHGMKTYVLNHDAYSISAGLDYPGIGPIHAYLYQTKRLEIKTITDKEAITAFKTLVKEEGIIPALESSHALSYAIKLAKTLKKDDIIIVNLSGNGEKDLDLVLKNKN